MTNVTLSEIHGILSDPDRPYWQFPGGCPAPLREGIVYFALGGACPMQASGTLTNLSFFFRARHGEWHMNLGSGRDESPDWDFSGSDPWDGHMPPQVAFALVTSKLLWHVCCRDPKAHPELEESGEWPPPDGLNEVLACGLSRYWQAAFRCTDECDLREWEWSDGLLVDPVSNRLAASHWMLLPPDPSLD